MGMDNANAELKAKAKEKLQTETDPLERLRLYALCRGVAGIRSIGRTFRLMDDDRNHQLTLQEFINGCRDYGCMLTAAEFKHVFNLIDVDGSGTINFDEFLIKLRPPMSDMRQNLVTQAFEKMDKTGDGRLTVDDMRGVFNCKNHKKYKTGEWNEDRVFQEYLRTFESTPGDKVDGIVTREEFMNYYSGVSASIDEDVYFDYMMRQAWKL